MGGWVGGWVGDDEEERDGRGKGSLARREILLVIFVLVALCLDIVLSSSKGNTLGTKGNTLGP